MTNWRTILSWDYQPDVIGDVDYMWVDDPDWDRISGDDAQMRLLHPVAIRQALEQMQDNDIVIMTDGTDYSHDQLIGKTVLVGGAEVRIP